MKNDKIHLIILKALDNENRLQILSWLKDPEAHFPPQVDGDLVEDGVCGAHLADKLGISAPALTNHMRLLTDAGLVRARKQKGWVFYKRLEENIQAALEILSARV